jgi:predicted RND superfamily exporter protein
MVWAAERRRLVLAIALVLALGSGAALTRLTFDHDVLHLLPQRGEAVQAFARYLSLFGSLDRLYVVVESAGDRPITDYAEGIAAFTDRLRQSPDIAHVDSSLFGAERDWSYLADRQLLLFDRATLPHVLQRFRPEGMDAALAGSRAMLAVPSEQLKQLVQQDPLGLLPLLRQQLGGGRSLPFDPTVEGYVSPDRRRRLIIVEPSQPPFDTAFARRVLQDIENARAAIAAPPREDWDEDAARPEPPPALEIAGGHRVAVETEVLVRRETMLNTIESLTAVLVLLLLAFRSPRLVLYGGAPIALASILVLAAAAVLRIPLSPAAAGSAAMLFGLGVDASVLLFVRYREEWAAGRDGIAVVRRLEEPARSIVLGVATTAATFAALLWMDFPSLQEMGALVGGGILICGALTLVLIPALMAWRSPPRTAPALEAPRLARFVTSHPRAILGAALAGTLVLAVFVPRVSFQATLDRLRPQIAANDVERRIAAQFGLPQDVYLVMAEGPDLEPLLEAHQRLADRLAQTAGAPALNSPVTLLPPRSEQLARAAEVRAARLAPAAVAAELDAVADRAGFRAGTFTPFSRRLPRLLDVGEPVTRDGLREHGLGDLIDRFVARSGDAYTVVAYSYPATPREAQLLADAARESGGGLRLTGTPLVNAELAERFWPHFRWAIAGGGAAVLLMIAVTFRRLTDTTLAALPVALGLLWTAGLLGAFGVTLDLFSAFGILTFLGIGVDYGIHFMMRYRGEPEPDPRAVVTHLGPAILLAAATTLAGFGTLCFSAYGPLRSLGIVLFTSVASAIAITMLVLPAILTLDVQRRGRASAFAKATADAVSEASARPTTPSVPGALKPGRSETHPQTGRR